MNYNSRPVHSILEMRINSVSDVCLHVYRCVYTRLVIILPAIESDVLRVIHKTWKTVSTI